MILLRDAFIQFAGEDWEDVTKNNQTAGVFVTSPNVGISNLGGAIDQVLALVRSSSNVISCENHF